jgi:hypothetical protein
MKQVVGFPDSTILRAIKGNAVKFLFLACLLASAAPLKCAADEPPETYKWKFDAFWWFSNPAGHFSDTQNAPPVPLVRYSKGLRVRELFNLLREC